MLIVRAAQLKALEDASRRRFEEALLAHLRQHLPDHVRVLGEDGTRKAIGSGVERTAGYQLVTEVGAAAFVRLMMLFGRDFDTDPRLPWAARILRPPELDEQSKLEALQEAMLEHLRGLRRAGGAA